jgi:hypothetical protein
LTLAEQHHLALLSYARKQVKKGKLGELVDLGPEKGVRKASTDGNADGGGTVRIAGRGPRYDTAEDLVQEAIVRAADGTRLRDWDGDPKTFLPKMRGAIRSLSGSGLRRTERFAEDPFNRLWRICQTECQKGNFDLQVDFERLITGWNYMRGQEKAIPRLKAQLEERLGFSIKSFRGLPAKIRALADVLRKVNGVGVALPMRIGPPVSSALRTTPDQLDLYAAELEKALPRITTFGPFGWREGMLAPFLDRLEKATGSYHYKEMAALFGLKTSTLRTWRARREAERATSTDER